MQLLPLQGLPLGFLLCPSRAVALSVETKLWMVVLGRTGELKWQREGPVHSRGSGVCTSCSPGLLMWLIATGSPSSSGWRICPQSPGSRASLCNPESIGLGLPSLAVSAMKGIGGRAFSWRKEFSFRTCVRMADSQAWLTSWKMVARDCGSPFSPRSPLDPGRPVGPTAPGGPCSPLVPLAPAKPWNPLGPGGPGRPAGPSSPLIPFGPCRPVFPGMPCWPERPCKPGRP